MTRAKTLLLLSFLLLVAACRTEKAPSVPANDMGKTWEYTIPPQASYAVASFSEGLASVSVDGKQGFINKAGGFALKPQFEATWSFSEGLAAVQVDGRAGYVDKTGRFVIKPQFRRAEDFHEGLAVAVLEERVGYIDRSGAFAIPPRFGWAESFHEGMASVVQNGKCGYINKTGKVVVEPHFDKCSGFSEGLAAVRSGEKWGYLDKFGTFAINPLFGRSNSLVVARARSFWDKLFRSDPSSSALELEKRGLKSVEYTDDGAGDFHEGLAAVYYQGRGGFIDSTGRFAIPAGFQLVRDFSEGLALVLVDDRWGYIDKTGRYVIPAQFPIQVRFGTEGTPGVPEAGIEASPRAFHEGLAAVVVEGKWGYIGASGRFVIAPRFDFASDFSDGLAHVSIVGKVGYIARLK